VRGTRTHPNFPLFEMLRNSSSRNGIHSIRFNWNESLAYLPGLYELWRSERLVAVGARGRSKSPIGKRIFSDKDFNFMMAQRVSEVAEAHGVAMAQIALAWNLSKPVVTAPIVGATKLHYLDDAVASLDVQLSEDEIKYLEEPYVPQVVAGYA
jgi:aryl-alcohol dehydrogenase-like predicted oxidoreductase